MSELYKISDEDIKEIVTDLLYNNNLLDDYEKKIQWLNEMPISYINAGKQYGDYPDLDGDTLKSELNVRIGCCFGDAVERELKKILQDYKYEPAKKDMTYVDVNNMSWKEIAAARDAWVNGKKIELNDSALPSIKSNGM